MSDTAKKPRPSPFQLNLDGEIVTLSQRGAASLLGMFVHLENLALPSQSDQQLYAENGSLKPSPAVLKLRLLDEAGVGKISSRDLGRQMIATARRQVRALQTRAQEVQALVLINNWAVARRLWEELLANTRTSLFELSLLEELWGVRPEQVETPGWSLRRHWQHFVLVQAEMEMLLANHTSLVQLSDILEQEFSVWLKRFGELLEKLDEESRI